MGKKLKRKDDEAKVIIAATSDEAVVFNKKVKMNKNAFSWSFKLFVFALSLSLFFSIISEAILSSGGIFISVIVIILLLVMSVFFDTIGVAITACSETPFKIMAEKNMKGVREALFLIRNSDKVASVLCDIIGDVCNILCGSAGAAIVLKIAVISGSEKSVLFATLISSIIAALNVFIKAIGKSYAVNSSSLIVYKIGRILTVFTGKSKK